MTTTTSATSKNTSSKHSVSQVLTRFIPKTSRRNTVPVSALEERLARRIELNRQLESAERNTSRLHDRINQQRGKQRQARDAVVSWQATVERERPGGGQPRSAHRLKAAQAELEDLNQRLSTDEHDLLALQTQANTLREDIRQLSQGSAIEEVREHLEALKFTEAEVARIEALIRTAETEAGPDTSADEALDALQQAREDLLADIAAGDAQPKELEALDDEIREILEDGDGSQSSTLSHERDNVQTLAGLKRRLSTVSTKRDALQQQTPEVIEQLLIARAKALSEDYLKHAQALQLCYGQLQGVGELLASAVPGARVQLFSDSWPLFLIPTLRLPTFQGLDQEDAASGVLCSGRKARSADEVAKARAGEMSHMDAMGVSELFKR